MSIAMKPFNLGEPWKMLMGHATLHLRSMAMGSADAIITSPPTWGLDSSYGIDAQIGIEPTAEGYIDALVAVFKEAQRVLHPNGTCWVHMGDAYTRDVFEPHMIHVVDVGRRRQPLVEGLAPRNVIGLPWRLAFGLQDTGWALRSVIVCQRRVPEHVKGRPMHIYDQVLMLSKSDEYRYNGATFEPKKKGHGMTALPDVWQVAHEAPYEGVRTTPKKIVERCVLAATTAGHLVLDPFAGVATTGVIALRRNRRFVGIDLNPVVCELAEHRLAEDAGPLFTKRASSA